MEERHTSARLILIHSISSFLNPASEIAILGTFAQQEPANSYSSFVPKWLVFRASYFGGT